MKTFEENWTAWLDGELTEKERAEFEATLPDISAAELEKQETQKLGLFLREQIGHHPMANEEFFHHQLRTEIERETRASTPAPAVRSTRETWWSIGRLAWSGAASLAIFFACTFFILRERNVPSQSAYLTQIINARVDPAVSPYATISIFESKEDKVTVVWVNGLQSLPSEYATK